ncbi:MAG: hypothetical protein U9Q15_04370 [Patescibacteria group bacterium]|nr:hypothetical protein [Patescibacteria group bacterium]
MILFLNRRGITKSLQCSTCGHVPNCPHCDSSLVFHRSNPNKLLCHICGYLQIAPNACPSCHGYSWDYRSWGTQRVEELVQELFPSARVRRMDRDTMKNQESYAEIYDTLRQ